MRQLADACPPLIAVDDAQWLDDATAEGLLYAVRRAQRLAAGVLVSVRADAYRPPTFETCVPVERRRDVPVGPLRVAALHAILKRHLQHSLPRPTLMRVAMACGGTASELLRQAIQLTPDRSSVQAARRAIRFDECCVHGGGDPAEATKRLEAALSACREPELRAELWLHIASCGREEGRAAEFYPMLLTALSETRNRTLAARLHYTATWMAQADPVHGLRHCDAALQLLDEACDPGLYSSLVMHRAYLQLISGGGADDAAIERGKASRAALSRLA